MAAVLAAWPASKAQACGACLCWDEPSGWAVAVTGTIPRNPRLLIGVPEFGVATLQADDGNEVEADLEPSGVEGLRWLRPRTLLAAGKRYALHVEADEDAGSSTVTHAMFEVGTDVDETPLEVRGTRIEALPGSGHCNLAAGAELRVHSIDEPDRPGGLVYAELDVTVGDRRQRVLLPLRAYTQLQHEAFGNGRAPAPAMCLGSRLVAAAAPGAQASATITYYDLAGHAVTVGPIEFTFGDSAPPFCPPAPGPTAGNDGTNSAGRTASETDAGRAIEDGDPRPRDARSGNTSASPPREGTHGGCSAASGSTGTLTIWAMGLLGVTTLRARRRVR